MEKDPNKIRLEGVRLSFPHLFTPHSMEEGKPKEFSAVFLLDNEKHKTVIAKINALAERVALDKFKKKVKLKHELIRDGNEKPDVDGYGDGVSFITAKCKTRPPVVDQMRNPLVEEDGKPYAGCYVNATINLYAWEHPTGGKGVSAGLRAVQFAKDGESFGAGAVNAEDEFDEVSEDPAFD